MQNKTRLFVISILFVLATFTISGCAGTQGPPGPPGPGTDVFIQAWSMDGGYEVLPGSWVHPEIGTNVLVEESSTLVITVSAIAYTQNNTTLRVRVNISDVEQADLTREVQPADIDFITGNQNPGSYSHTFIAVLVPPGYYHVDTNWYSEGGSSHLIEGTFVVSVYP